MALTVKKLIVEVVNAHNLTPKDGVGTSSPYVIVEFNGQTKRTNTIHKNLNPVWNEKLEFVVNDPNILEGEALVQVCVYNDLSCGGGGRSPILGQLTIEGSEFVEKGAAAMISYPFKSYIFHPVTGELGLRVYHVDEPMEPPKEEKPTEPHADEAPPPREADPPEPPPESSQHGETDPPEPPPESPLPEDKEPREISFEASPLEEQEPRELSFEASPLQEQEPRELSLEASPLQEQEPREQLSEVTLTGVEKPTEPLDEAPPPPPEEEKPTEEPAENPPPGLAEHAEQVPEALLLSGVEKPTEEPAEGPPPGLTGCPEQIPETQPPVAEKLAEPPVEAPLPGLENPPEPLAETQLPEEESPHEQQAEITAHPGEEEQEQLAVALAATLLSVDESPQEQPAEASPSTETLFLILCAVCINAYIVIFFCCSLLFCFYSLLKNIIFYFM